MFIHCFYHFSQWSHRFAIAVLNVCNAHWTSNIIETTMLYYNANTQPNSLHNGPDLSNMHSIICMPMRYPFICLLYEPLQMVIVNFLIFYYMMFVVEPLFYLIRFLFHSLFSSLLISSHLFAYRKRPCILKAFYCITYVYVSLYLCVWKRVYKSLLNIFQPSLNKMNHSSFEILKCRSTIMWMNGCFRRFITIVLNYIYGCI